MDENFRIRVRAEAMSFPFEFTPQFAEVVDLPVEDDTNRAVLVGDRLIPVRQIDDRQPAMRKPHASLSPDAFCIWTTMRNRPRHATKETLVDETIRVVQEYAGDSTHCSSFRRVARRVLVYSFLLLSTGRDSAHVARSSTGFPFSSDFRHRAIRAGLPTTIA